MQSIKKEFHVLYFKDKHAPFVSGYNIEAYSILEAMVLFNKELPNIEAVGVHLKDKRLMNNINYLEETIK